MNRFLVLPTEIYQAMRDRLVLTERLALELREQRDEEHHLLILALTELAAARGSTDRQYFQRRWLREKRGEPAQIAHNRARKYATKLRKGAARNGAS